ncbi:MAG: ABC transporter ATP-binding protein [Alphaproteobacteria bacterium]
MDTVAKNPDTDLKPAVELTGVTHRYGSLVAVRDLSFTVGPGEVVCLLGPSGCGKTTALRIAAGLETPSSGTVHVAGRLVSGDGVQVPPESRHVGLVFQDYALFPHLSVVDNVAFGLPKGGGRKERAMDVLDLVGMTDYADAFPHMLSGGQQQRVALARALAPEPALVMMDEPFSGLDARLRDQVRDNTLHALKNSNTASLMVTHDAEEAMYLSDRIIVMRDGELVQEGSPADLYNRPVDPFVAAFFGDVNTVPGVVDGDTVDTAIGQFPAGGAADGQPVEVVVRPEALKLAPSAAHSMGPGYAKVLASRMLGRTSLVHLCTCKTTGEELHLHARVPGSFLPGEEEIMAIEVDRSQAFVFPVSTAK